jgi:hypothetical protein
MGGSERKVQAQVILFRGLSTPLAVFFFGSTRCLRVPFCAMKSITLPIVWFLSGCGEDSLNATQDSVNYPHADVTVQVSPDSGAVDAGPTDAASDPNDVEEFSDTGPVDSQGGDVGAMEDIGEDTSDPTTTLNAGFIGGPCEGDDDCDYEDGFCFTDGEGFPQGMCSLPCELYCPDQDGMVTTFCIDAASADVNAPPGLCTMRCDYSVSETGCRPGYQCVMLPRHNDPGTIMESCVPEGVEIPGPVDPTNCQQQLADLGLSFTQASNPKDSPEGHPDLICNIKDPIMLTGVIHGVNFRYDSMDKDPKPMFMTCPLALALEKTALLLSENGVTDVLHWGIYNCRVISGTNKLSQHGLANAIDIKGLVTDEDAMYEVLGDWEKGVVSPVTEAGQYLKWFAQSLYADWIFNVILTPEYNAAHADHFHVDLTPGAHSIN